MPVSLFAEVSGWSVALNVLILVLSLLLMLVILIQRGKGGGLAGAFGVTRVLRSLLVQVSPTDPLTFVSLSVLLSAVAVLACWIPARRAMRVDPVVALRYE